MNYEQVAEIVREEISDDYVPNACILAARVTTLALREFGVQTEAMAAMLDAFSPAYMRMRDYAEQLGRELTDEEVGRFAAQGAWHVEVNSEPARPGVLDRRDASGYHGHVVALADDRRWLLDPTLGQVNRPHKGLVVEPPFAYRLAPDDWEDRMIVVEAQGGAVVTYRLIAGRKDFSKAPDWRAPGPRKPVMERVLGRVIERIAEEARDVVHHR
jgi:hypothetical protein